MLEAQARMFRATFPLCPHGEIVGLSAHTVRSRDLTDESHVCEDDSHRALAYEPRA
jgi:hypothetical protein